MGMIVAFYAVPAATYADTADACEVAARSPQVASVSINSRAVGDVLAAFSATYLSPLVADADMTARVAYVPTAEFLRLAAQTAMLRSQMPLDAAVLAYATRSTKPWPKRVGVRKTYSLLRDDRKHGAFGSQAPVFAFCWSVPPRLATEDRSCTGGAPERRTPCDHGLRGGVSSLPRAEQCGKARPARRGTGELVALALPGFAELSSPMRD